MASGSQMWRGNIALFPAPPMNIRTSEMGSTVIAAFFTSAVSGLQGMKWATLSAYSTVPAKLKLKLWV